MKVKDLNISLPDTSANDFANELLNQLIYLRANFSTHAMSDRTIFLQGQKQMLEDIIDYLVIAKP